MTRASGPDQEPNRPEKNDDTVQSIRSSYLELVGHVPPSIEARLSLADQTGRMAAVEEIEALRTELIMANPLGRKVGQLVHFGQLLALGQAAPARLHPGAAYKAGATLAELLGVAELALITSGIPNYSLGVEILSELTPNNTKSKLPESGNNIKNEHDNRGLR